MKKRTREFNIAISIIIGAFVGAFSFNNVILPNNLISGGIGGAATIISVLSGINVQIALALLCLPILIWAYKTYGFRQIIYAFSCFFLFTMMISLARLLPVPKIDIIPAVILSGILSGISGGVVLRLGVANGPEGLIGVFLKERYAINVGVFFTVLNTVIVVSSGVLPNMSFNTMIYSLFSIFISGKVTDFIVMGFRRDYEVTIISEKYKDITEFIHNDLKRGATFVKGIGTYDRQDKILIKTIVSNSEAIVLKDYVKDIDGNCFIYVNEITEVFGRGFND